MSSERNNTPPPSVLRMRQLSIFTGMCRSKIYLLLNPNSPYHDPAFPRPIRLGGGKRGAVGWLSVEVQNWLSSRPRAY